MRTFTHFESSERKRIEKFLKQGKSLRWIAIALGRSVSSLSEEVKRNKVNGIYVAKKADHKAYVKRKYSKVQCLKVATDGELKQFVTKQMMDDQSPEGISGRLREVETHIPYASTKAVYKFVKSIYGRRIERHLYSKAVKKKGGPKRGQRVSIDGRVMIDERPKKVEKRLEFGHFEGDFIESGKDGKGSLLVLVERKTRYPFLRYLEDRSTKSVNKAVQELLSGIPIESLTIDNDISFQKHEALSALLETAIYFCHPQSPHEKGTIENRNKAIRRYVKKRSDLSTFSKEYFTEVERKLRTKFMKCLQYKTPEEAFNREMQKIETKKATGSGMMEKRILLAESVRIEGFR